MVCSHVWPPARLVGGAVLIGALFAAPAVWAADPRVDAVAKPSLEGADKPATVTARQAFDLVTRNADIVLVDVRTFGETVFTGVPTQIYRHVPYLFDDDMHEFDARNGRYKLVPNSDFPKAMEDLVSGLKGGKSASIILICSVGERSARAAEYLARLGFENVYSVADGIDGFDSRGGERPGSAGHGWRGEGLPWSSTLRPDQAYKSPSM